MNVDDLLDLQLDSSTVKVRLPVQGGETHPVIFLIHGWTGDERSMWVFAPRLPKNAFLVAPRAPYVSNHAKLGGYSWVEQRAGQFSKLSAFDPALVSFDSLIAELARKYPEANFANFGLMGFSQGAAFSFAYALRHSVRVNRLAALAGFLPAGAEERLTALAHIPVFIAHGTKDETVPVAMAHEARDVLASAKVSIQYCESDTSHKLGANCATRLAGFFKP